MEDVEALRHEARAAFQRAMAALATMLHIPGGLVQPEAIERVQTVIERGDPSEMRGYICAMNDMRATYEEVAEAERRQRSQA